MGCAGILSQHNGNERDTANLCTPSQDDGLSDPDDRNSRYEIPYGWYMYKDLDHPRNDWLNNYVDIYSPMNCMHRNAQCVCEHVDDCKWLVVWIYWINFTKLDVEFYTRKWKQFQLTNLSNFFEKVGKKHREGMSKFWIICRNVENDVEFYPTKPKTLAFFEKVKKKVGKKRSQFLIIFHNNKMFFSIYFFFSQNRLNILKNIQDFFQLKNWWKIDHKNRGFNTFEWISRTNFDRFRVFNMDIENACVL